MLLSQINIIPNIDKKTMIKVLIIRLNKRCLNFKENSSIIHCWASLDEDIKKHHAVHQPSRVNKTRRRYNMTNKKTKLLIQNGVIAAMYLALTIVVSPVAQGPIQFRISESLNHLVVFNKKLMWGVFGGVVIYNLLFSEFGWLDIVFGGAQTLIALSLTAVLSRYVSDVKKRLALNIFFFTISMALIACMLHLAIDLPFWPTYGTTALSEFIIMTLSAPIMYGISQYVKFDQL